MPFEGMLPVRTLRAAGTAPSAGRERGEARRGGRDTRGSREQEQGRDWWELNEQGTILRGERSGASLALGQEIAVRVERIDTIRGRVDLAPAG